MTVYWKYYLTVNMFHIYYHPLVPLSSETWVHGVAQQIRMVVVRTLLVQIPELLESFHYWAPKMYIALDKSIPWKSSHISKC